MALTAQRLADGEVVRSVVLFSVLVYELVGPALTKRALIAAGEIRIEGKTNAATMINSAGDYVVSFIVSRFVDGKDWLQKALAKQAIERK
mgnify:CR=1 FL=1